MISIHSPYTGRDPGAENSILSLKDFNPLSLYRERPVEFTTEAIKLAFQSTLPIQGETYTGNDKGYMLSFQSTLPIQGETLFASSIGFPNPSFQSTLPIQGETGAKH